MTLSSCRHFEAFSRRRQIRGGFIGTIPPSLKKKKEKGKNWTNAEQRRTNKRERERSFGSNAHSSSSRRSSCSTGRPRSLKNSTAVGAAAASGACKKFSIKVQAFHRWKKRQKVETKKLMSNSLNCQYLNRATATPQLIQH